MNNTNHWLADTMPFNEPDSGKTVYWHGSDTEENFLLNGNPEFANTNIVYKFNSSGFRTQEFDMNSSAPSILCLGCSFTLGTGLPLEQVWPSLIAKEFPEYNTYNLGIGGSSGDTIARLLYKIGNKLNTKIVCILWPEIHRLEVYNEHHISHTSVVNGIKIDPKLLLAESHFENLKYKNQALISLLQKQHNYNVIEFSTRDPEYIPNDRARDPHPGPKTQYNIFQMFKQKIIENKINVQS